MASLLSKPDLRPPIGSTPLSNPDLSTAMEGDSTASTAIRLPGLPAWLHAVGTLSAGEAAAAWQASDSPVVGWLQPGDRYAVDQLESVHEIFLSDPTIDVVYGNAELFDRRENRLGLLRAKAPTRKRLRNKSCLIASSVFFRRASLERLGFPDGQWHYWAAYEHWLRMADAGARFVGLDRSLSVRIGTPGSPLMGCAGLSEVPLAVEELTSLLQARFGSAGFPWALWMGRALAAGQGLYRHGTLAYDRCAVSGAVACSARAAGSGTAQGWRGRVAILARYGLSEAQAMLRRPRYAVRLLPAFIRYNHLGKKIRQLRSPRLFRLHCDRPAKMKLKPLPRLPELPAVLPRIGIVTPNYNCGQFLERTLKSVLDQSYPNLEYHVQDGGSGDASLEIIRSHSQRLNSWESARDRGQANAINLGFARIGAEIMGWLNSDDVLLPGSLKTVGSFFAAHPEVDVVYGHRLLIDSEDRVINRWILPNHDDLAIGWADYIPQETMFWRRSIWERTGGRLDESFQFAMDWDLILRFRAAGARFERLPCFLGAFRITDQQKTSQLMATVGQAESDRLRQRELGFRPSDQEVLENLQDYLRRHWWADKLHVARSLLPVPVTIRSKTRTGASHAAGNH